MRRIFSTPRTHGRVVVTDDTDFLVLAGATSDHPGIVFCRRNTHSIGEIIRFLILIHGVFDSVEIIGRVEFL